MANQHLICKLLTLQLLQSCSGNSALKQALDYSCFGAQMPHQTWQQLRVAVKR